MSSPGPEHVRGITSNVVDALRSQPMSLALIVIVILFAYFSWQGISVQRQQTHEIVKILLERCGPTRSRHLSPIKEKTDTENVKETPQ